MNGTGAAAGGAATAAATAAATSAEASLWQETTDPSGKKYYYHTVTKAVSWTNPVRVSRAVHDHRSLYLVSVFENCCTLRRLGMQNRGVRASQIL